MATFGETVSKQKAQELIQRHGRDKVVAMMNLPADASPDQIKGALGVGKQPGMFDNVTAEDIGSAAGGIGAVSGLAAPFVQAGIAGGGVMPAVAAAPGIAGGLLLGAGLGAATDYAMKNAPIPVGLPKEGWVPPTRPLGELLTEGGARLRSSFPPEPTYRSVPRNLSELLRREASMTGAAANALEAAPALAGAYTAAKASPYLKNALVKGKEYLFGVPKIKVGQEANAMLAAADESFGGIAPTQIPNRAPSKLPDVKGRTGEFRAAMETGREKLGGPVGFAKKAAYEAIPEQSPEQIQGGVGEAITKGLVKRGGVSDGTFKPAFSGSKEASQAILKQAAEEVPQIRTIEEARTVQRRFADQAAKLRDAVNPGGARGVQQRSPEANVYSDVEREIDSYIKSLIPPVELAALESANAPFSAFSSLQALAKRANTQGQFDPGKMKALWATLKPADRLKMDPKGVFSEMLLDKDPGKVTALWRSLMRMPPFTLGKAGAAAKGATRAIEQGSPESRFNAPPRAATPSMREAGGIAGLLGSETVPEMPKRSPNDRRDKTAGKWKVEAMY